MADPAFLTNGWIENFVANYSYAIMAVPSILIALVKFIALVDPKIPSNSLIDWIQATFYKTPATPNQ